MLFGFGLFNRAGATGHVFYVANGKRRDKGLAYSSIVGPGTTVAVVPTIQQVLSFSLDVLTNDKQSVSVTGDVKVTLVPEVAVAAFDFSVNSKDGSYREGWQSNLQSLVTERVLGPIRAKAKTLKLEDIVSAHADMESAITNAIGSGESALLEKGVRIDSCSVPNILPDEEDLSEALGASEREAMLTEADAATHERQMKASANARAVKAYEAATALTLEKDRAKLVDQQGKNKLAEAKSDAEALAERMKPLNETDPGKVLAAAIYELGKSGRVGSINLSPELLDSIRTQVAK